MTLWEWASRKIPFSEAYSADLIPGWVKDGEREDIPTEKGGLNRKFFLTARSGGREI
jgi:hypothetical protein